LIKNTQERTTINELTFKRKKISIEDKSDNTLIKSLENIIANNDFEQFSSIKSICDSSSNIKIQSLILELYSKINIDKAFETFSKISKNQNSLDDLYYNGLENLISNCLKYDKFDYVNKVIKLKVKIYL
jgi:hypothetical protein